MEEGVYVIGEIVLETIYWYTLPICVGLAVLLVISGDVLDFDGPFDSMLIIPWLTFTSLFGSLGERLMDQSSLFLFIASGAILTVLVSLLNFYPLMPMKHAKSTMSSSEKTLEGQVAVMITLIPIRGMGEVQSKSVTGSISRPACFYSLQEQIAERGTKVLIVEIKERICYVMPYGSMVKA